MDAETFLLRTVRTAAKTSKSTSTANTRPMMSPGVAATGCAVPLELFSAIDGGCATLGVVGVEAAESALLLSGIESGANVCFLSLAGCSGLTRGENTGL